jgi:hypothetical protein
MKNKGFIPEEFLHLYKKQARLYKMKGGDYVVYNLDFALVILNYDKTELAIILEDNPAFNHFLEYVTPTPNQDGEKIVFTSNEEGTKEARIHKSVGVEGVFYNCCVRDSDISVNFDAVKDDWIWYKAKE